MRKYIRHTAWLVAALLVANLLSCLLFFRLDFTASKRYSLSPVSRQITENLSCPVTVDFYVTEDLPQDIQKLAKEFSALLKEYQSLSNAGFTVNIIHPDTRAKELAATAAGIEPVYTEIRERDMEKIQRIFIGAVFRTGKCTEVIPHINFATPMEYEITRILKQAVHTSKPTVGFVRGHDEFAFRMMPQLINELSHLYHLKKVNLNASGALDSLDVLCIVAPKNNYSAREIERLEQYLDAGGKLFIALNHAIAQLDERKSGFINRTGIEDLLEGKGLKIKYDFVVDNNCGTIAIRQQYGLMNFRSDVSFPYVPIVTKFGKHAITQGLNSLLLPFASSIEQQRSSGGYAFTPLARTSSISGVQQAPIFFDLQKQWARGDFNHPNNIVAALLAHRNNNSAIVAVSNANFISDEIVTSGPTDNIRFAVNSIEWLADNSGLIRLRNKFTTFSFLEPVDEHYRKFLKYLNFLLPIGIVLLVGIIQYRYKKYKRDKRS